LALFLTDEDSQNLTKKMGQEFLNQYQQILNDPNSLTKRGNLTLEEYAAISAFVSHSYDFCAYLRADRQPQESTYEEAIQAMQSLLAKSPPAGASTLYRGTYLPNAVFNEILATGQYNDKAFVSTTDNEFDAKRHMVMNTDMGPEDEYRMVVFIITHHHNGRDISHHSSITTIDGNETVFHPETTFQVTGVGKDTINYTNGSSQEVDTITLVEE